eukprot:531364-Prorocentrum_minimum.AAC.3
MARFNLPLSTRRCIIARAPNFRSSPTNSEGRGARVERGSDTDRPTAEPIARERFEYRRTTSGRERTAVTRHSRHGDARLEEADSPSSTYSPSWNTYTKAGPTRVIVGGVLSGRARGTSPASSSS